MVTHIRVSNRSSNDGASPDVETSPSISILNALLRAGVSVRHDCGGKAQCGTCRFRVLQGASSLSPTRSRESLRLTDLTGEKDAGTYRLACQTHAAGDIEIELLL